MNDPTKVESQTVTPPVDVQQRKGQFANDSSPAFRDAQAEIAAAYAELKGQTPPAPSLANPLAPPAVTPDLTAVVTSPAIPLSAAPVVPTAPPAPAPVLDAKDQRLAELEAQLAATNKKARDDGGAYGTELKRWKDRIAQLEAERAEVQAAPPAPVVEDAAAVTAREKAEDDAVLAALTPEQREQFPELADMNRRMLRAQRKLDAANAAKVTPARSQEVETLKAEVARIQAQSDAAAFQSAGERLSPGFASDNGNPAMGIPANVKFLEFLDTPSAPGSPLSNADIYKAKPTPETAAWIHKQFRQTAGSGAASATSTQTGSTATASATATPSPADLVPPSTRSAAAQSSANPVAEPKFSDREFRDIQTSIMQKNGIRDAAILQRFEDYRQAIFAGVFKPAE